jgi:hypothetical protein
MWHATFYRSALAKQASSRMHGSDNAPPSCIAFEAVAHDQKYQRWVRVPLHVYESTGAFWV